VWGTRFPKLNLMGRFINQITYALGVFFYLIFDLSKRPILVVTNPPFLGIICAILKACGGKPYIYLIFDVYPDCAIRLGIISTNGIITKLWNYCNRFIFRYASAVVVLGSFMKEKIIDKGKGINLFPEKIHLISVWSDDINIYPIKREENPLIKEWKLEDKFVLSYSGNIGVSYDMETIMAAAKLLDRKDIVFVFIGEGYQKKWMMEYMTKFHLTNCYFYTYINRDKLKFSLNCAHVGLVSLKAGYEGLLVPSKTFGLLAAGVPIIGIVPRKSEIALILEENNCGVVIEPGRTQELVDAIMKLYSNPTLREIMGKNAREALDKKYNLRAAAIKYKNLIENLQYN
jgi:glycosyltransferase involved in cell wall biosynthesis